jgi:hypothetical protein
MMAKKKRTNPIEENASSEILRSAVSIQEKIALLAYTYWEQRGRTGGSPEEDWFRAEREIISQMSVEGQ